MQTGRYRRNWAAIYLVVAAASAGAMLSATVAQAGVTISSQPTQDMTCSNGVCAPTAKNAVLNTGDLEADLTSGNVTVTTTGAGVEADNVAVKSPLSWATANTLSLTAHRSITIDAPVSVVGQSGLSLQTGVKKGTLSFGKNGRVGFSFLSSQLAISGTSYTLVGNIKTLAAAIAANPGSAYALAGTYDASADGIYTSSPIGTIFTGMFEGLGNTIVNLSVNGGTNIDGEGVEGLFAKIGANGTARGIGLVNATVDVPGPYISLGGALAGVNLGSIQNCYATGTVTATSRRNVRPAVGGLVGENDGSIADSYATARVVVRGKFGGAAGLVGLNSGTISQSYATGAISGPVIGGLVSENVGTVTGSYATGNVKVANDGTGGGLVGISAAGTITNSYARGAVTGPAVSAVGGFAGSNDGSMGASYSTGAVTGGTGSGGYAGGFVGGDLAQPGSIVNADWDTTTSGITNLSQGAGTPANDPGITGLSTAQFQAGLPTGFDPKIWGDKGNINGGLPYLLASPPPK